MCRFVGACPPPYPQPPPPRQVFHPNIDEEGKVCLNILRADWKPVLTMKAVIFGLELLFIEPNPDDPLNKGAPPLRAHGAGGGMRRIGAQGSIQGVAGTRVDGWIPVGGSCAH